MDETSIKYVIEAALLASGEPLSVDQLMALFDEKSRPERKDIRAALTELEEDYADRGIMLAEVASGFRVQLRPSMTTQLQPLWEERPPRYSRALFETLALIAYRQPITRGEIEDVRGVAVSPNIIRTLLERDWIRVLGHRDVPGKPEMFGTTKGFLDYFGLKRLDDLPPLAELRDIDGLSVQLDLPGAEETEDEPRTATVTALRVREGETPAATADESAEVAPEPEPCDQTGSVATGSTQSAAAEESGEDEEAGVDPKSASAGQPSSS